jgi:hypothetical protein
MNYTQFSVFLSLYFFYPLLSLVVPVQRSAPLWWSEMVRKDPHLFRDTKIRTSFVFRKDPHLWHVGTRQLSTIVVETGVKRSV